MARYRRCPYCEQLELEILEIDPHGDVQDALCRYCGYTGWCAQCDEPVNDPHYLDDPQHCSEECAARAAAERAADNAIAEWKLHR